MDSATAMLGMYRASGDRVYILSHAHNLPGNGITFFISIVGSIALIVTSIQDGYIKTRPYITLLMLMFGNVYYFWAVYYFPTLPILYAISGATGETFATIVTLSAYVATPYVIAGLIYLLLRYITSGFVRKTN